MENSSLLRSCTAEIVSAYVRRTPVASPDIPNLMNTVYMALCRLDGELVEPVNESRVPAIPIKRSLRPDAIICLECGFKAKMLRRHIQADHDLTPEAYKARWRLPADYPMTAPDYSRQRSNLAKEVGLGRGGRKAVAAIAPPEAAQAVEPTPAPAPLPKRAATKKPAVKKPAKKVEAKPKRRAKADAEASA